MATLSGRPVDWAMHDRNEWREEALCAQTDPEAFFPEKGGSVRAAKAMCARCPVRVECLDDAIASDEVNDGVRGGLSPRQRRAESARRGNKVTREPLDEPLIAQLLDTGHRPHGVHLRWAEAHELFRRLTANGMSKKDVERLYGINPGRHKGV